MKIYGAIMKYCKQLELSRVRLSVNKLGDGWIVKAESDNGKLLAMQYARSPEAENDKLFMSFCGKGYVLSCHDAGIRAARFLKLPLTKKIMIDSEKAAGEEFLAHMEALAAQSEEIAESEELLKLASLGVEVEEQPQEREKPSGTFSFEKAKEPMLEFLGLRESDMILPNGSFDHGRFTKCVFNKVMELKEANENAPLGSLSGEESAGIIRFIMLAKDYIEAHGRAEAGKTEPVKRAVDVSSFDFRNGLVRTLSFLEVDICDILTADGAFDFEKFCKYINARYGELKGIFNSEEGQSIPEEQQRDIYMFFDYAECYLTKYSPEGITFIPPEDSNDGNGTVLSAVPDTDSDDMSSRLSSAIEGLLSGFYGTDSDDGEKKAKKSMSVKGAKSSERGAAEGGKTGEGLISQSSDLASDIEAALSEASLGDSTEPRVTVVGEETPEEEAAEETSEEDTSEESASEESAEETEIPTVDIDLSPGKGTESKKTGSLISGSELEQMIEDALADLSDKPEE